MDKNPKKILIVRTDRMGDVVLSTPVIANLRRAYPGSWIAFMCRPYTKDIVERNPFLDEVIVYDKYGRHKGFMQTVRFAFSLRAKRFDWAIVLHPTNRAHLVTFLAGIPYRIGWERKMSFFLTRRLPFLKDAGECHELDYTLQMLGALGVPVTEKKPFFPVTEEASFSVKELLKSKGIGDDERFLVIHPSASCPSKRWPQERFVELITILTKKVSCRIIIVTSKSEALYADEIVTRFPDVVDLRGTLSLSQLGALLANACIFISNDSGPVHVAASVGTPVISLFGRSDKGLSPVRWAPLGEKTVFIHKDAGCTECRAHDCVKGFICLQNITAQEVYEAVEKLLGAGSTG